MLTKMHKLCYNKISMVTLETAKKMIEAATSWWSQKLGNFSVEGKDNVPESFGGAMMMFGRALSSTNDGSEENVRNFYNNLTEYLLGEYNAGRRSVTLGTDYAPEWPLSDICRKSNVTGSRFSNKTTMWVDFERGTVNWSIVRGPEGQLYPKTS